MKAEATLARDPAPTREALARSLAGNLCRCTGYVKVLDALETVAAVKRGETAGPGARAPRPAWAPAPIATTAATSSWASSRSFATWPSPGMLHGAVVLSAHPRAIVKRIDTSAAEQVPGVVRIATWRGTSPASGTRA